MLKTIKEALGSPVEIEFAMTINPNRFGFLQVRRMVVAKEMIEIGDDEFLGEDVLLASDSVCGNGKIEHLRDIVYVKPDSFETRHTRRIATELAEINTQLVSQGHHYLLIALGRLGTTDPWLGIPVRWGQISGARAIVESTQQDFKIELSQGSHYFHNMTSLGILYYSVPYNSPHKIDWNWLASQEIIEETSHVRHVRTKEPLKIKVDGRKGKGLIQRK